MMNEGNATNICDPEHWNRVGGREFQFFATDTEIRGWLLQGLPEKYAPYHLVGADIEAEGAINVRRPFLCELSELPSCIRRSPPRRWIFWIWSEVLTPGMDLGRGDRVSAI